VNFISDFEPPNPDDFEEIQIARRLGVVPDAQIDRVVNSLRSLVEAFRSETENSRASISRCNRVLRNELIVVVVIFGLALLMGYGAWQFFGLLQFGKFAMILLPFLVLAVFCSIKRYFGDKQQVFKSYFDNWNKYRDGIASIRGEIGAYNRVAESELDDWDWVDEGVVSPPTVH